MSFLAQPNLKERVALGLVRGWESFRQFGQNDDVPSSGGEEMWPLGTARVLPTSAAVAVLSSSSAADDGNPEGTGAWSVLVEGLDANYDEVTDTITTEGTSDGTGTTEFLRVNRAFVLTAGSAGSNVGNITITVGGDAQAYIEVDEGQTQQTQYTVPRAKVLVINNLIVGVGRMSGNSDLHVQSEVKLDGADTAWRSISEVYLFNGGALHQNSESATVIPAKTEIRQVIHSSSTTQAYSIFSGFQVRVTHFDV